MGFNLTPYSEQQIQLGRISDGVCLWRACGTKFTLHKGSEKGFEKDVTNHLSVHLRDEGYYTGVGPIICWWDGPCATRVPRQTYVSRKELTRHLLASHGMQSGGRISCPSTGCAATFTRKESLTKHLKNNVC